MKVSKAQIKKNMGKWIGCRCLLLAQHRYANQTGNVNRIEEIKHKPALIIKLDNGEETEVFNPNEIMFLEPLQPVN